MIIMVRKDWNLWQPTKCPKMFLVVVVDVVAEVVEKAAAFNSHIHHGSQSWLGSLCNGQWD